MKTDQSCAPSFSLLKLLGTGLLASVGMLSCAGVELAKGPVQPPPAAAPVVAQAPAPAPTPAPTPAVETESASLGAADGLTVFERVEDYGFFPETVNQTGPFNVVPKPTREITDTLIRGAEWPMVYNHGTSQVYPPEEGYVSFYHEDAVVATGEKFIKHRYSAAHKTLPFGTIVRCTRKDTNKSVVVTINDRGPYVRGRIIDLSPAAAKALGLTSKGVAPCKVEVLAYPLIETMGPKGNG